MKIFLLTVLVIQLLATNKHYSQGLDQKSTKLKTYKGVTIDKCDAYTKNIDYTKVTYETENEAKKTGTCKIWSKQCECTSSKETRPSLGLPCKNCKQNDKTVIFWNIEKSFTWIQASDYCKTQGGGLVAVKDEKKEAIIKAIAKKLFPDEKKDVAFWIGLYRKTFKDSWKYSDGYESGPYSDWNSGYPHTDRSHSDDNCAEITNGGNFKWGWENSNCKGNPGWTYYPMCEVRIKK